MRGVKVFSGRSHPSLAEAICQRLGMSLGKCDLGNFANGETSVQIGTSIRNEEVFIVQSGSRYMNDSVMELLIMIAACKGGSAKSITAVMPYFPYARSSKKKSHRGPITAKMLANLLTIAGLTHVITVDLHASQMQGFFHQGVDNLHCEPLIARWIKANVPGWQEAVVVSKNVGGSKRVTSLADTLKLNFAITSTDRKRSPHVPQSMSDSVIFFDAIEPQRIHPDLDMDSSDPEEEREVKATKASNISHDKRSRNSRTERSLLHQTMTTRQSRPRNVTIASSPLVHNTRQESRSSSSSPDSLLRVETAPNARRPSEYEAAEGFHDEKAREVVIGRLIHGHIVDDDHPSPALSSTSTHGHGPSDSRESNDSMDEAAVDPLASSIISTTSSLQAGHALGGTFDAAASSDEEDDLIRNPQLEHTVTLVGNVKDRIALIMDDIMDRSGSWVAAAETCVKRGGARKVYCIGIHALLGENALEEMEACDCIDHIVVTNTFPITPHRLKNSKKLIVIDLSNLLSEAIRRNHHGESISKLFMQD